jgi:hypothetical protein
MGIGDFIRDRQAEGMSDKDILPLVKSQFAEARTTINSIRWYRTNPKKVPGKSPQQSSTPEPRIRGSNSRYKTHAIGNAQNSVVRNILSKIGEESFNETDWHAAQAYFSNRCVYCDEQKELVCDHAIPINKTNLGEHRIGNLVPSCKECNEKKGGNKDFRAFLEGNGQKIDRILEYMLIKNYVPMGDNKKVKTILELAHKEVAAVAERYIAIINSLFSDTPTDPESIAR